MSKNRPAKSKPPAQPPMSSEQRLLKAVTLQQEGAIEQAAALFLEELRLNPLQFAALYSMAAIENRRAQPLKALDYIDRALRVMPRQAMAHQAKAIILQALGRGAEATLSFDNARRCEGPALTPSDALPKPKQLEISHPMQRLALHYQGQGDVASAKDCFQQVLLDLPGDMLALYSLMVIASQEGQTAEALALIDRGIAAMPDYAPAYFAKGTMLQGLGLFDAALLAFDQAILLQPDYLEALNNRASLLQALNKIPEAYLTLTQALRYKPDDQKILMNTGMILTTLKRNADAVKLFDKLIELNPDYDYAQGYRFFAKLHTCDWTNYEPERQRIIEGIRHGKRLVNPLAFFAMCDDPALQLKCAQMFTEHRFAPKGDGRWAGKRYKHNKLRLGYVSPDLREHPVGHLMAGLIEQHDKTRVETFAFSLGIDDGSALRRRFKLGFDHFLDCKEKTSAEIIEMIKAAEIDVLVDLAGYTAGSKSDIFAARAAPMQVNYLGYPGSMGAPWMDFILADEIVIPSNDANHYQERVLHLPHCYLPLDDSLSISERTPRREEYGLPAKGVVFCSFNHDYKINPPIWGVWMALLHEHPGSVLWLMKLNDDATGNLQRAAQAYDIDPQRIVFATRVPRVEDHLARYQLADVFMDTTPYNAHSTATDVLRVGLPIVSMQGGTFAARVGQSIARDFGVSDQIASDLADYKAKILDCLARSPEHRFEAAMPYTALERARAIEEALLGAYQTQWR
jgi:protein O-GlcNAc transferase